MLCWCRKTFYVRTQHITHHLNRFPPKRKNMNEYQPANLVTVKLKRHHCAIYSYKDRSKPECDANFFTQHSLLRDTATYLEVGGSPADLIDVWQRASITRALCSSQSHFLSLNLKIAEKKRKTHKEATKRTSPPDDTGNYKC